MTFLLLKLSLPTAAGMTIYSLFSLVDTFFVAQIGSLALAALTFSIPLQVGLVAIVSATGVGLTSLIARTLSAGDLKLADNIAGHGVIICLLYGLLAMFVAHFYLCDLLHLFGCSSQMLQLAEGYLKITLYGSVFLFMPLMLGSIIQGEGNTLLPMVIALTGILINVALDPLLIIGYGPIQGMGLNGSALATVLAQIICTIQALAAVMNNHNMKRLLHHFRFDPGIIGAIYKVGFPTIIMEMAGVFVMAALNKILAGYGSTAIAAWGIFLRVRSFFYMPVYGLIQGILPIAGFAYGNGNLDRVREALIKTAFLAAAFTMGAFFLIQLYSQWFIGFFAREATLISAAEMCMRIGSIFMPLMGPSVILYAVLQAIGKGTSAMMFSLIRNLLFFYPLLIILPPCFGLKGVWMALSLSELLGFCLSLFFFISLWRELQVKNKLRFIVLFNLPYILERTLAWLKPFR